MQFPASSCILVWYGNVRRSIGAQSRRFVVGPNIRCTPDSDSNIFDRSDPAKPGYIGKHPGTAFMEMQFYPPGAIISCDATHWSAALNIDSLSQNFNTGQGNNSACGGAIEYVNFAFIQNDGVPFPPGSPAHSALLWRLTSRPCSWTLGMSWW